MKYFNIKGTDLKSSCISIGAICAVEGDTDFAFRMLDIYREHGGNIIDSANVYGKWFSAGTNICDANIGKWLRSRGCRDSFIVTTKGGHPPLDDHTQSRLNKADVLYDVDECLTALGTDHIDLFYLHRDYESIPAGEIIEYLNDFVKSGKLRYFGCSNWNPDRIAEANDYACEHGLLGFVANQLLWSMAIANMNHYPVPGCKNMDDKTFSYHKKTGLSAFAYASQAGGYFTKLSAVDTKPISDDMKIFYGHSENIKRFDRAVALCEKLNLPLSSIVLAYLTSQPFPTSAIIGSYTEEKLLDSLRAADLTLSPDDLAFLVQG